MCEHCNVGTANAIFNKNICFYQHFRYIEFSRKCNTKTRFLCVFHDHSLCFCFYLLFVNCHSESLFSFVFLCSSFVFLLPYCIFDNNQQPYENKGRDRPNKDNNMKRKESVCQHSEKIKHEGTAKITEQHKQKNKDKQMRSISRRIHKKRQNILIKDFDLSTS